MVMLLGFVCLGKMYMFELVFLGFGYNFIIVILFCINNKNVVSGGFLFGVVVLVVFDFVFLVIGLDIGGFVRILLVWNDLVGFKMIWGWLDDCGIVFFCKKFDMIGFFCCLVEDVVLVLVLFEGGVLVDLGNVSLKGW